MERIIHVGLLEYLYQKGTLSTLQYGRKTKLTTTDHLLTQEVVVMKAQVNNEHVTSVFFYMENAYDLAWRHDILKDFKAAGITGRMFNFIQKFLKPRSLMVKIKEILSSTRSLS